MEININIEMNNDAFTDSPEGELGRILKEMSRKLLNGRLGAIEGKVKDINGNTVGLVEYDHDEEEDGQQEEDEEPEHTIMILPAHWAGCLINGDQSDAEAVAEVTAWSKTPDAMELGDCLSCGDESFFSKTHDAMSECKACNCLEYTFNVS